MRRAIHRYRWAVSTIFYCKVVGFFFLQNFTYWFLLSVFQSTFFLPKTFIAHLIIITKMCWEFWIPRIFRERFCGYGFAVGTNVVVVLHRNIYFSVSFTWHESDILLVMWHLFMCLYSSNYLFIHHSLNH